MKKIFAFLTALFALSVSCVSFASQNPTMNIQFINMINYTGNALLVDTNNQISGPILEKNGGTATMSTPLPTQLQLPGLGLMSGLGYFCVEGNNNLVLNPLNYKGDLIVVTLSHIDSNGWLECTCTGSACDVGATRKKST